MRGAKMNSCIAPPMVWERKGREREIDKWQSRDREERREKEGEREYRVEDGIKRKFYVNSLQLAARQQGRVQSPRYLPLCI